MERRTYTVTEAATVLGISRTSAYERVRAGDLPALRLGRRIVIARAVVDAFVSGVAITGDRRDRAATDATTLTEPGEGQRAAQGGPR
jgi:excisionase family DNA binding protein